MARPTRQEMRDLLREIRRYRLSGIKKAIIHPNAAPALDALNRMDRIDRAILMTEEPPNG